MYKIGEPCSACPPGTSCSEKYPGLCSGDPEGPVTIRPPLRNGTTQLAFKLTFGCVKCKSRNLLDQNLVPSEHPFHLQGLVRPRGSGGRGGGEAEEAPDRDPAAARADRGPVARRRQVQIRVQGRRRVLRQVHNQVKNAA